MLRRVNTLWPSLPILVSWDCQFYIWRAHDNSLCECDSECNTFELACENPWFLKQDLWRHRSQSEFSSSWDDRQGGDRCGRQILLLPGWPKSWCRLALQEKVFRRKVQAHLVHLFEDLGARTPRRPWHGGDLDFLAANDERSLWFECLHRHFPQVWKEGALC